MQNGAISFIKFQTYYMFENSQSLVSASFWLGLIDGGSEGRSWFVLFGGMILPFETFLLM